MKITTSILEQRLLTREFNNMQAELNRGLKIINAVLQDLPHSTDSGDRKAEQAWILEQLKLGNSYSTGSHKHNMSLWLEDLPLSVHQHILDRCVREFLNTFDGLQDNTKGANIMGANQ